MSARAAARRRSRDSRARADDSSILRTLSVHEKLV